VLQQKSPAEAESYKAWLAAVTAKVSFASREDRHIASGRSLASADEEEALRDLAAVLAVDPPVRSRRS
jgi:hypothetical protein